MTYFDATLKRFVIRPTTFGDRVRDLLNTQLGEQTGAPDYGVDLLSGVDQGLDEQSSVNTTHSVVTAARKWIPDASVARVQLVKDASAPAKGRVRVRAIFSNGVTVNA